MDLSLQIGPEQIIAGQVSTSQTLYAAVPIVHML